MGDRIRMTESPEVDSDGMCPVTGISLGRLRDHLGEVFTVAKIFDGGGSFQCENAEGRSLWRISHRWAETVGSRTFDTVATGLSNCPLCGSFGTDLVFAFRCDNHGCRNNR